MLRVQFTPRTIVLAAIFIGIGVAGVVWGRHALSHHDFPLGLDAFLDIFSHFGAILGGAALIGAGIGTPLSRKWEGMLVGVMVLVLIAVVWMIVVRFL